MSDWLKDEGAALIIICSTIVAVIMIMARCVIANSG